MEPRQAGHLGLAPADQPRDLRLREARAEACRTASTSSARAFSTASSLRRATSARSTPMDRISQMLLDAS